MKRISVYAPHGAPPNLVCRKERERIIANCPTVESVASKFLFNRAGHSRPDEDRFHAIEKHLSECEACRDWVRAIVPEEVAARFKRQNRYCCDMMFDAVEDSGKFAGHRVAFGQWDGLPCWMIDGRRSYAAYCPWCGGKLPGKPFVPDPII